VVAAAGETSSSPRLRNTLTADNDIAELESDCDTDETSIELL
jgi:hypothetical protein